MLLTRKLLTNSELDEVYDWIDGFELSRPKKY